MLASASLRAGPRRTHAMLWKDLRSRRATALTHRRDGRVVEGARLESVYRGNSIEGSNPSLSAISFQRLAMSHVRLVCDSSSVNNLRLALCTIASCIFLPACFDSGARSLKTWGAKKSHVNTRSSYL